MGGMNDGEFLQDANWLSKSCSSLDAKGSGSTLTSTDVPKIGPQSCPTLLFFLINAALVITTVAVM